MLGNTTIHSYGCQQWEILHSNAIAVLVNQFWYVVQHATHVEINITHKPRPREEVALATWLAHFKVELLGDGKKTET